MEKLKKHLKKKGKSLKDLKESKVFDYYPECCPEAHVKYVFKGTHILRIIYDAHEQLINKIPPKQEVIICGKN